MEPLGIGGARIQAPIDLTRILYLGKIFRSEWLSGCHELQETITVQLAHPRFLPLRCSAFVVGLAGYYAIYVSLDVLLRGAVHSTAVKVV